MFPESRLLNFGKVCPVQDPFFTFFIKKGNKTSFKGSYKSRIDKFVTLKEKFSFFQFF